MSPWQSAYIWALEHGVTPQEWHDNIGRCLLDGYVVSTPQEFIAFYETQHDGQPAYFVYVAAGGSGNVLGRFMRYATKPLPYVIWHRRNEARPRVFAWDKLMKKAGGQ